MNDPSRAGLLDKLEEDVKKAMREGDKTTLSTLRMVIAAAKNAQLEKKAALEEGEVLAILQKGIKTRRESVEAFRKGNREELAAQEEAEIAVLERYLPKALGPEEVAAIVEAVIAELGAKGPADTGRVMKEIMARHRGRVDGKAVQALVASRWK